ncbi:MAG: 4-hydroxybenzoate 3-monooxygenase [Xanthomonadaceae bacterium]|nr:4-hydroxybenzoate 3-monooxygenase [Xanthomonadaceae bacterium]
MSTENVLRTQVGIVGAGPAGLLLARMLQQHGIESVILERRSRSYVLSRVRAGVLEQGTVDTLIEYGVGERLKKEGLPHEDMQLRWSGRRHAIPLVDEDGRTMTTYGQAKIVEDLMLLREADGLPIHFEAEVSRFEDVTGQPVVHFQQGGQHKQLVCDYIAGCDGYLGVSRSHIPGSAEKSFLREFPFSWFGILAEALPQPEIRGFSHTQRGLAVASARSANITRNYLQVPPSFDIASMSDEQIWDELDLRMQDGSGNKLNRGPIIEKSVARLRGFVCETMHYGKLFLAGDAAHIVPPSGAKGLNLAVGDVRVLLEALVRLIKKNDRSLADRYSEVTLRRIWPTVQWSCRLSEVMHFFPGQSEFDTRLQYAQLEHWIHTPVGQHRFRQSMLGLPYQA